MIRLKVTQIGNSLGVVLPKELLARLKVGKGDTLFVTEAPGGAIAIGAYDPAVEEQVRLGLEFMKDYRDAFRALAK